MPDDTLAGMLREAAEYRAMERFSLAFDRLKQAMDRFGAGAEFFTEWAITAYAKGGFAETTVAARKALALEPGSIRALLYLALGSGVLGKIPESLAAYDKLLEIDPNYTIAYTNRGLLYESLGRMEEAFAEYDKAIRRDPADYKAHYNRANLLYSQKHFDKAFADYDWAIGVNPTYVMAYGNRGATYLELEHYAEAIRDFTEAIRCEPRAIVPLVNRGVAHWRSGNRDAGYADLRHAMDLDPFNPWPLGTLGDLLEKDGRWPEALQFYDKAASLMGRLAEERAAALRAKLGLGPTPVEIADIAKMFPIMSGNQWLDIIAFWVNRLESSPGPNSEAFWKGLPFPELLVELREASRGRDASYLRRLGDAAFSRARTAYRDDGRKRDAIQHLYRAVAYFVLGADLENLVTAMGNLGASLADIRHVDEALRVQSYALELKQLTGSPPANIARSLRIIAELEEVRGHYSKARNLYEGAVKVYTDADMERGARELDGPIAHLDAVLYLVNEFLRSELQPPEARTCSDLMVDAGSEIEADPRGAALKLYLAVEAARRAGQTKDQLQARLRLARLLYEHFSMFREAYRHFAAAAILASSSGDKNAECDARLWQARVSGESGDFGASRELLLLALSKLSGDPPTRIRAEILFALSLVCFELGSSVESSAYINMALKDAEAFINDQDSFNWLAEQGQVFKKADLRRHALLIWWRAILGGGPWDRDRMNLIESAAHLLYNMREWRETIRLLELAVVCAKSLDDLPAQSRAWTHLGMCALEIEDYELAEHAKQQAEALPVKPEDNAAQADLASLAQQLFAVEMSKGITSRGAWETAEAHRARPFIARSILRTKVSRALATSAPEAVEIADSFAAMAMSSDRAGQTTDAFKELFEGLRTLRRLKLWRRRADLLQVYAIILTRHRRVRSAWRALRAALVARRRFDAGRNVGPLLACIGECYLQLSIEAGRKELIAELEQAGEFESEGNSPEGLLILSRLHEREGSLAQAAKFAGEHLARTGEIPDSQAHARALAWAANIHVGQKDLDGGETFANRVFEISARKQSIAPECDRLEWRRICAMAAEALLAVWYTRPRGPVENAARALALIERIRLRSLLERYGRDFISTPESFPDEFKNQEQWLLTKDRMRTDYSPRLDPDARWKASLFDAAGELEKFWTNLPEPWRAYGQLRLGEPGDPQAIVNDAFALKVHILALFPTESGVYRWHLDPNGATVEWKRSPLPLAGVQSFTRSFVAALANDVPTAAEAFGKDLFGASIDAIPAGETIAIVPSGPLLQLPFNALPWGCGYLIERNPIAVVPALSLLPYWGGKRRANEISLVVADSLGDLPAARKEAALVAKLLKAEPLIGASVRRLAIGPALQSCGLLHVACHAFFNERDPAASGFWLADRGVFSARDFTEGRLRVRVAVLSACESGRLDVAAADELSGLAASMLLCGVSTVVSTLWRIPDENTRRLMTRFYEVASRPDEDMAAALALAQRELIADAATRTPFHWAAFQLIGKWHAPTDVER